MLNHQVIIIKLPIITNMKYILIVLLLSTIITSCKRNDRTDDNKSDVNLESYEHYIDVAYGPEAPYEVYLYILNSLSKDDLIIICEKTINNHNNRWFSVYLSVDSESIVESCSIQYSSFKEKEKAIIKNVFVSKSCNFDFLKSEKVPLGLTFRIDINKLCYCYINN